MVYQRIIKPILFLFDPEKVHYFTFRMIRWVHYIPGVKTLIRANYMVKDPRLKRECFGLTFPNPVGMAAGFDKDAKLFNEFSNFGFGFIEIGTITPKPQKGNPKKRLFRLVEDNGIINRMGFNNLGVDAAALRLRKNKGVIIGGNIGKNKHTPNHKAIADYKDCFHALFNVVDYFVVNVSSPNTPNLRELQEKEPLTKLLRSLQNENSEKKSPKPILLKIAPDLTSTQLLDIIDIVHATKIAGIIATNTTLSRKPLKSKHAAQLGGLSGKPLSNQSNEVIRFLHQQSNGAFPIIGVGGIHSVEDALEKFEAGATLIQLYTGFVYEGPALIHRINKALIQK